MRKPNSTQITTETFYSALPLQTTFDKNPTKHASGGSGSVDTTAVVAAIKR
jgi:hypothetical protein